MNTRYDDDAALERRLRAHYAAEYADTPDGATLWHAVAGQIGVADAAEPAMEPATERRVNGRVAGLPGHAPTLQRPTQPMPPRRRAGRLSAALAVAAAALVVVMGFAVFHFARPGQGAGDGAIPRGALISDVQMLSPADGWAVGSADYHQQTALVLHFTGGQWRLAASFANARLEHLSMVSATEGWAVGLDATVKSDQHSHRSFLVRYIGGKWVQVPAPIDDAAAIHMFSADSGYLVGLGVVTDPSRKTTPPDVLAIYDHGHWRASTLPTFLFPVALVSPTEGWGYGDSQFWGFHGGQWTPTGIEAPAGGGPWIDMLSATEGWAAGFAVTRPASAKGVGTLGSPYLWHCRMGACWEPVEMPNGIPQDSDLRFVHMQSADSGWAWGFTNRDVPPLLLRFDGHTWTRVPLPGNVDLSAISSASPTEAWAAGQIGDDDAVLLHYLDGKWTVVHL
ncbi:MAG TPA: hypothetical protein VFU88_04900 [Ktedonobacterales bacterium]|nr:hypothetical protein [Ktedonobacterales bacterium]